MGLEQLPVGCAQGLECVGAGLCGHPCLHRGDVLSGQLAQQILLEAQVRDRTLTRYRLGGRFTHDNASPSNRATRSLSCRRRLRTPETDMPTSSATSCRVMPSSRCITAMAAVDSFSWVKMASSIRRATDRDSGLVATAMFISRVSSGSSGRRLRVRMRLRHTLVAMR